MKIELNIFTNSTKYSPQTKIIKQTYDSFCTTFGKITPRVWMDPNPKIGHLATVYKMNLQKIFKTIYMSRSLSDGYVKAIQSSTADYLFMLEHDWIFKKELIYHTLDDIIECMEKENLVHFRFNKRDTIIKGWDKNLEEKTCHNGITYCITNTVSNNPHLINRKKYIDTIINKIEVKPGSKGIEEILTADSIVTGAIYGPLGYPATVYHIDGRGGYKKHVR